MTQQVDTSAFDPSTDEGQAIERQNQDLASRGEAVETKKPLNLFGFGTENKFYYFPDNVQYIEYKVMNSGMRDEYEKRTSREVRIQNVSKDMKLRLDPAADRAAILEISIVGWNVLQADGVTPLPFSKGALREFLKAIDPSYTVELEMQIRKDNPWLMGDTDLADLYEQRDALEEQIREAEAVQGE